MTLLCRRMRSGAIAVAGSWIGMLFALGLAHGCTREGVPTTPVAASRSEAIEVAKKELARHGYSVGKMVVGADEGNRTWQSYLRSTSDFAKYYRNEIEKLEGRQYWAVYLAPAPVPNTLQGGGDAFVFVETGTGTVLSVILFK
jgi:hypothetical protein